MGMNNIPASERTHIGFFGRRNAGKSSIVNAVTGQELAVVSDVKGTTTDPVYKTMELLPLGPVMIIDTPGFDDEGMLGELRVKKTKQVLNKTDIAVLVVDATEGLKECDRELIQLFQAKEINYLIVYNKSDLLNEIPEAGAQEIYASALKKENIYEVKERIAALKEQSAEKSIIADKLKHRTFMIWGLIFSSIFIPLAVKAPSVALFLACLLLGMIGNAFFHPQVSALVKDFNKNNPDLSRDMGIFLGLGTIGYALGPYIATYTMDNFGENAFKKHF